MDTEFEQAAACTMFVTSNDARSVLGHQYMQG